MQLLIKIILKNINIFSVLLLSVVLPLPTQAQEDSYLEQQLHQYLMILQQDETRAKQHLQQLYEQLDDNAPLPAKVRLLSYLTLDSFYQQQNEQSEVYFKQLKQLGEQTDNPDALAEIVTTELELLFYRQQLSDAFLLTDQLLQLLEHAQTPRIRYYSNNVLGRLFMADGQYEQALQHFTKGLDALMETDDELTLRRRSFLNYNIARVLTELKKWPQAKALIQQLIDEAKQYQHMDILPELYLMQGYVLAAQKDFAAAVKVNELGLAAAKQLGYDDLALTFENNLGALYIEQEQYDKAKIILEQALAHAEKSQEPGTINILRLNIGFIKVMEGQHEEGLTIMRDALAYFQQLGNKAEYEPYYEWLAKAYAAAGQHKNQANTLLEQMALREAILTADRENRVAELQSRYDSKSQQQRITILQQENDLKEQLLANKKLQQRITWLFILLMFFAAVSLWQLYRKVRHSNLRLNEANKQLQYQSLRDPLTGLFNRRALQEQMQLRITQTRRSTDQAATIGGLLLLDLDFFKRINDHYGHSAGDAVLIELSERLSAICREQDLVVRWGGEELLLYLANIDPSQIAGFISRVLATIADTPVQYESHSIRVTVSGGFIHLPFDNISEQELNWEQVLQIADMALYLSKTNGRNQVYSINGLNVDYQQAKPLLYSDLASAIEQNMVSFTIIEGPGSASPSRSLPSV